jgi:integrase
LNIPFSHLASLCDCIVRWVYLTVEEAVNLLNSVRGKPYQLAIWLQLLVGLRVGEVQSLRCGDVDITAGTIRVRSTYVRKEKRIQDHPKEKAWHSVKMPPDLAELAAVRMRERASEDFIATELQQTMLQYNSYLKALKKYCEEAGVRKLATHGLRHSTSEIYLAHGATRDDLYKLFKHSSLNVTECYIHDKNEKVMKIADVIRLSPYSRKGSNEEPNFLAGSSSNVAPDVAQNQFPTRYDASEKLLSS